MDRVISVFMTSSSSVWLVIKDVISLGRPVKGNIRWLHLIPLNVVTRLHLDIVLSKFSKLWYRSETQQNTCTGDILFVIVINCII